MDMRAPRIGWPFHSALNSAPTLLLMSTDAGPHLAEKGISASVGDRSRAYGARRGPGRCTEAPDTSPPPARAIHSSNSLGKCARALLCCAPKTAKKGCTLPPPRAACAAPR